MTTQPKMHLRAERGSRDTLCGLLADPGGPSATDDPAEVTCRSCLKNHGDIDRLSRAGAWHDGWTFASRDGDGNLILRYKPTGGLYRVLPVEET